MSAVERLETEFLVGVPDDQRDEALRLLRATLGWNAANFCDAVADAARAIARADAARIAYVRAKVDSVLGRLPS